MLTTEFLQPIQSHSEAHKLGEIAFNTSRERAYWEEIKTFTYSNFFSPFRWFCVCLYSSDGLIKWRPTLTPHLQPRRLKCIFVNTLCSAASNKMRLCACCGGSGTNFSAGINHKPQWFASSRFQRIRYLIREIFNNFLLHFLYAMKETPLNKLKAEVFKGDEL
jgi:hypothetical protein